MRQALPLALAVLSGCGLDLLGDYEPGGAANLPTAGAGPYLKLAADLSTPMEEPIVLADRDASLADPAALPLPGGGVRLWFSRIPVDGGASAIALADLGELGQLPRSGPTVVLTADAPWEAGAVGKPAVLVEGDELVLYYEGGGPSPAIGRAVSTDGGASFRKDPANPVLVDATSPGATRVGGQLFLYHGRPGSPAIHLAVADDGRSFGPSLAVIEPRRGLPEAFDQEAAADPSAVTVATLDPDEPFRVALLFGGSRTQAGDPLSAIGFAGSFDGIDFERGGLEAAMAPDAPSEAGPAVILAPTRALLFFHEQYRGRLAIGAATSSP
jgi:hypothetical protein